VSEDLLLRSLPFHLSPTGDVAARPTPIGNPRFEFLPKHREDIEAEVRGLIENWKDQRRPLDNSVRHPFSNWASVVGGILKVNGFENFLQNYSTRRSNDDPVRHRLGLLGAAHRDCWELPAFWAGLVADLGLEGDLIPPADRGTPKARSRGIGVTLSRHDKEEFGVTTDDLVLALQLKKQRRRFEAGTEPSTRYAFVTLSNEAIGEDAVAQGGSATVV